VSDRTADGSAATAGLPFTMLGSPEAVACEGDACLVEAPAPV